MYCQRCSAQNPDNVSFCRVCGALMKQIQQPTDHSPNPHTVEPQQQYPSERHLMSLLGKGIMWFGIGLLALFAMVILLVRSIGLIELVVLLIISSIPIILGLLLRYLSRAGGEQNRRVPSAKLTAELSEHAVNESLSAGASSAMPVSSVTEATTELLEAKQEGRVVHNKH